MDEKHEKEFSEESLKRPYNDIKKFLIYSEEERSALCGYIPMTEEIFEKCRSLAFACWDTETIYYLIEHFPEFPKKNKTEETA